MRDSKAARRANDSVSNSSRSTQIPQRKRGFSSAPRFASWVAALAVAIAVAELMSFLPGGWATGQSRTPAVDTASTVSWAAAERVASLQLEAAEGSLQSGGGPAGGEPLSCTASEAEAKTVDCGVSPPSGLSKPLVTTTPSWSYQKQPSVREYAAMTYDVRDKYVLLFGGFGSGSAVLGDTWKFAGGLWTQLHPAGSPPARYGASMAFDGKDNYVLLFGGYSGSAGLSDTWKFVGGAWTKLTPTINPGALVWGSITYDAKDGYVVFFGGATAALSVTGKTWEFLGGQWIALTPSPAPPARYFASFDYDAAAGYAVLFGGTNSTYKQIGDTWNFSGGHWTKLTLSPSPSPRGDAAMAYSAKDGELVLFGGSTGTVYLSDTWTFLSGAWTKISTLAHPSGRGTVTADGTPTTNVVLFGGQNNQAVLLNDTWTFHGSVWANAILLSPSARFGASMTYDEADGYVLLFGGENAYEPPHGALYGDTWKFLHGLWTPLRPSVSPPPRVYASMTYDQADGYVVLFGGANDSGFLNDTWTYLGGVWTEVNPPTSPAGRSEASMTYDFADGYVLLFGGLGTVFYSDTWVYSAGSWTVMSVPSPSAREGAQMAYDSEDGYVLLFSGGLSPYALAVYSDTWTYSGGVWSNITGTAGVAPGARELGGLVDDTYDGYLLLFLGFNPSTEVNLGDTWSFVNGAWAQLSPATSPPAQNSFAMAFDPLDHEAVMYTALGSTTWTY
jgi:galactose oxidase-like protein